jgi:hypothetical protein
MTDLKAQVQRVEAVLLRHLESERSQSQLSLSQNLATDEVVPVTAVALELSQPEDSHAAMAAAVAEDGGLWGIRGWEQTASPGSALTPCSDLGQSHSAKDFDAEVQRERLGDAAIRRQLSVRLPRKDEAINAILSPGARPSDRFARDDGHNGFPSRKTSRTPLTGTVTSTSDGGRTPQGALESGSERDAPELSIARSTSRRISAIMLKLVKRGAVNVEPGFEPETSSNSLSSRDSMRGRRAFNIDEELQSMLAEAKTRGLLAHAHFRLCWWTTENWRRHMIHDLSPFAHAWNLFVTLIYVFGGLAVPPIVCWQATDWKKVFEHVVSVVLLINSFLFLATTQVQSNGRRVTTHREIRAHYFRNELLIDLVATVPISIYGYPVRDYVLVE